MQKNNYECTGVIVIVDYFKAQRVVENVISLLSQKNCGKIEICIIDNSCDIENEETLSKLSSYPNVHLKFNKTNTGYIRACNDAASLFNAKYVVLVNPDIVWKNETTLAELFSLLESNPDIGIVGPRQINDDGSTPDTVRSFPNIIAQIVRRTFLRDSILFRKIVNNYEINNFDYAQSQPVDWIQSSLLAIRGNIWNELGGLDTSYFIFMSDPDICYKSWQKGYKVFYTADTTVGADGKRCSEGGLLKIFTSKALQHHLKDAVIYQIKYLFKKYPVTK